MQSEQINELAAALSAAQGELAGKGAKKGSTNPHLGNKYADLTACWDALGEVLPKHGLAVIQTGHDNMLVTTLMHKSGQWVEGSTPIIVGENRGMTAMQALGSAWTYARRYGLAAITGLTAQDDDGHGAGVKMPVAHAPTEGGIVTPPAGGSAATGQPEPSGEWAEGIVESVGETDKDKSGKPLINKKGQPYKKYGVKIVGVGWMSTFSDTLGEVIIGFEQGIRVRYKTVQNGKYLNLVDIEPIFEQSSDDTQSSTDIDAVNAALESGQKQIPF